MACRGMDLNDEGQQLLIGPLAVGLAIEPGVIAAAGYLQHLAEVLDSVFFAKLLDHAVTPLYASERMPMVFF